ncbi:MAG: hypothetical protein C4582_08950 [Desulfobacteraceae bacterium]|nr:MAG: hypothetical protein C4582_08950 [Desulfobacteraceae bacterium]
MAAVVRLVCFLRKGRDKFRRVKKLFKRNANARDKVLTTDQFIMLSENSPSHMRAIIGTAYYTGMRRGEILSLTRWMTRIRGKLLISYTVIWKVLTKTLTKPHLRRKRGQPLSS